MELLRALAVLAEPPAPEHERLAEVLGLPAPPDASAHAAVFLMDLHPYASVYLGNEGQLGGEARDRVAGFWQALHQAPPGEPDHLSSLLGLAATLSEAQAGEDDAAAAQLLHNARGALFWEHILPWMPMFLQRVEEVGGPFYGAWATLVAAALRSEVEVLGILETRPRHLAEAKPVSDPREDGADALLASLLAPVRSGFILLRGDLGRAGAELELGLRAGERRFVLKSLLAQDAPAVLRWIADEAQRQSTDFSVRAEGLGLIREHWAHRASATVQLLRALATEAEAGVPA